jgi:4-amino-4-deoxy-L-arabinose transferase-like glycosyltransferase
LPESSRTGGSAPAASLAWRALLLLAVLWVAGIGTRSVWTPDEPREYALSVNMLVQSQPAVPLLAGESFAEKPPLTYWAAAVAMRVFGANPVIARIPNLFYGLIAAVCTALLAAGMVRASQRSTAFVVALVVSGTSWLCYLHAIWLATDAPLLAASAVAWLGAWRALSASTDRARLRGYLWFGLGLGAAFLAKNLLGLIGPLLGFGLFVLWENRWRECARWQLWAGVLLAAAIIGAWVLAVALQPDGRQLLRVFLWDNSIGRFLPVASSGDYRSGHLNSPGKLVSEVALGLMPWLPVVLLAWGFVLQQSWRRGEWTPAARFLSVAALPLIVLLSFSSTVRDVYALPSMVPLTAAVAVWCAARPAGSSASRVALRITRVLLYAAGLACLLLTPLLLWVAGVPVAEQLWRWLALLAAAVVIVVAVAPLQRAQPLFGGLGVFALGLVSFLVLGSMVIERGQDLRPVARLAASLAGGRPLLLTTRDETMSAALDYSTAAHGRMTADFDAAARAQPEALALVEVEADRLTPTMRARLARLNPAWAEIAAARPEPVAQALFTAGWSSLHDLPNPGGRHYQLLVPPAALGHR